MTISARAFQNLGSRSREDGPILGHRLVSVDISSQSNQYQKVSWSLPSEFSTGNSHTVSSFLDSSLLKGNWGRNRSCPTFRISLDCCCQLWQHFLVTPTIWNLTVRIVIFDVVWALHSLVSACNHTMISHLSCWPGAIRELAASHQPFTPSLYIHDILKVGLLII